MAAWQAAGLNFPDSVSEIQPCGAGLWLGQFARQCLANLFLELEFPPEKAERLYLASKKQINEAEQLKEEFMAEVARH